MDLRVHVQLEIPIWVDGRQKWLTGLTKRTTCDDVIYALLSTAQHVDADNTHTYAIYERWRDVERPLQGRTKILKVWKAWGAEQKNVKLQLHRVEDLAYSVEWSRTRRRPRRSRSRSSSSRGSQCKCPQCGQKETEHATKTSSSTDSLVELVECQEKKIKTLFHKIQDTDKMIDSYEIRMHHRRVKNNGQNYVQDAYLASLHEESSEELNSDVDPKLLDKYLKLCDKIILIEDRIMEEREKIQILALTLNQERYNAQDSNEAYSLCANGISSDSKTADPSASKMSGSEPNNLLNPKDQLNQLQIEINKTTSLNLQQGIELETLVKELRLRNEEWLQKKTLLSQLISNLDNATHQESVDISQRLHFSGRTEAYSKQENTTRESYQHANSHKDIVTSNAYTSGHGNMARLPNTKQCYTHTGNRSVYNRNTSKVLTQDSITVNSYPNTVYPNSKHSDNDSDTGLSSMHSDESPAILETLV